MVESDKVEVPVEEGDEHGPVGLDMVRSTPEELTIRESKVVGETALQAVTTDDPVTPEPTAAKPPSETAGRNSGKDGAMDAQDIAELYGLTPAKARQIIQRLIKARQLFGTAPPVTRKRATGQLTTHYRGNALEKIMESAQSASDAAREAEQDG